MKTTKEIAELFCAELDRAAKGEVRNDVVGVMEKCANGLIKLARLEMDFAFRNWGEQPPSIPWIATKSVIAVPSLPVPPKEPQWNPTAKTSRGQQIEKEILNAKKQLESASGAMEQILTDKIKLLQNKLERAEAANE